MKTERRKRKWKRENLKRIFHPLFWNLLGTHPRKLFAFNEGRSSESKYKIAKFKQIIQ